MDTTPVVPRLSLSALVGGMGGATAAPFPSAPKPPAPPVGGRPPAPCGSSPTGSRGPASGRAPRPPHCRPRRLRRDRPGVRGRDIGPRRPRRGPVPPPGPAPFASPSSTAASPGEPSADRCPRTDATLPVHTGSDSVPAPARSRSALPARAGRRLERVPVSGIAFPAPSPGAICGLGGSPYTISPSVTTSGDELDHPVSGLLHTVWSVSEEKWWVWKGP